MLIAPGFVMLSISAPVLGQMDTVHPVLLWDERDVVLVDTGFPRQVRQVHAAMEACGVDPARLNRMILTHQDIDHIGNLEELAGDGASRVEVSAHALEKPYIQGDRRLLRFTDEAIAGLDQLPDHVPEAFRQGLKALMLRPPRAEVRRHLADGDRLPWCGGLTVIETPGHTPGHISLLHEPSRTLIAGDALTVQDGQLQGADPRTTLDRAVAQASLRKLSGLGFDSVVCYHGGFWRGPVRKTLGELASADD